MTKKLTTTLTLLFVSICFIGCASNGFLMAQPNVTVFKEGLTPRATSAPVDVYYSKVPDVEYDEIALISVGDTDDKWSMDQIKIKAREVGAEAVIIVGRVGSYGVATGNAVSTGVTSSATGIAVGEGYGLEAIAIKYKK